MTYFPGKGREDAFGDLRAQNPTPLLSQPSHYEANPERHRVFINGNRLLRQYETADQYEFGGDVHLLKPDPGDTVAIETAEKPRYTVQFELEYSFAFGLNQQLAAGDIFRFGAWDGTNGYYFERRGEQPQMAGDFVVLREDTAVVRREDIPFTRALTYFQRWALLTNWYNVGAQDYRQTYTTNFTHFNDDITTTSVDDGSRGPKTGNLPLRMEITASGSTSGLVLEAGSFGCAVSGNVTARERQKGSLVEFSYGGSGDWEPLYAWRIDPTRAPISGMIRDSKILSYDGGDTIELMIRGHDPSKVLNASGDPIPDGDWGYDGTRDSLTSAIQSTATVDQGPDTDGNTGQTVGKPGGWQAEYAAYASSGGFFNTTVQSADAEAKAVIYDRDVYVLWAKSASAGDGEFLPAISEEW